MSLRSGRPSTEADPGVSAIVVVTFVFAAVGVLLLIRAQFNGSPRHVSVRIPATATAALERAGFR